MKVTTWENVNMMMVNSSFGELMRYKEWCFLEMARRSAVNGELHRVKEKIVGEHRFCCVEMVDK